MLAITKLFGWHTRSARFGPVPRGLRPSPRLFVAGVAVALATSISWSRPIATPFSAPEERCILSSAQHHGVNPYVLRAILQVESGMNPASVRRNSNQSIDVGIGQINSVHFEELASYGIQPWHLLDACIGTYAAAWHLKNKLSRYGNTWEAIARYHSSTPLLNRRYQVLVYSQLVRSGIVSGPLRPVAPGPRQHGK
jgi:soluble lytic murein transglycosylase-like protein